MPENNPLTPRILDFCGGCGTLLPPGLGLKEEPTCKNCGSLVKARSRRIRGTFSAEDSTRLNDIYGYYGY